MANKTVLSGKYSLEEQLSSEHAMGLVYKAVNLQTQQTVVVKSYNDRKELRGLFQREIEIHKNLNHPGIVPCLETFEEGDKFHLVLEYLPSPLQEYFRETMGDTTIMAKRILSLLKEVGDALMYLQGEGILHRDVKPENIRVSEGGKVKLIDLGAAVRRNPKQERTTGFQIVMGTVGFMPPEMLFGDYETENYDIFGLGQTALIIAYNHLMTPSLLRLLQKEKSLENLTKRPWLDEAPHGFGTPELLTEEKRWLKKLAKTYPLDFITLLKEATRYESEKRIMPAELVKETESLLKRYT